MENKNNLSNKEILITVVFAAICLYLFLSFPSDGIFQKFFSGLTFLLAVPILYNKFVLKRKNFVKTKLGEWRKGIFWSGASLVALSLIMYAIINYTVFFAQYNLPESVVNNFWAFVLYELVVVGFFLFLYEFFFRGFLMNIFISKMKNWAIIFQAVLFFLFLLVSGGLNWSNLYFVIIAPFSGIIAYKSNSIAFSFATSLVFIIIADAFMVNVIKLNS